MNKLLILTTISTLCLSSCNDFLDREPLDSVPTTKYLYSENDLAAYSANMYQLFPVHSGYGLGVFSTDNNSDNQAGTTPNSLFVKGQTRVGQSGGDWDLSNIRSVNYFINLVRPRYEAEQLTGDKTNISHYLGEMYFFRAYIYFNKLVALGDFPIIKYVVKDDYQSVREASKRMPRNEVARFIINDLDSAYVLMKDVAPMSNRLNKDCAALFKSRVALFEGTWEKYHKGTARVPGGPGWPGAKMDYLKDFTIDIDAESKFFLTEAKAAAELVADKHALDGNYEEMFNRQDLTGSTEVLLWKKYDANITPSVTHWVVGYLQRDGGGNSGYTRSMMQSYTMADGKPWYASSDFKGDKTYDNLSYSRDPRLKFNTTMPGDLLTEQANLTEAQIDKAGYYYRAPIIEPTELRCPTGYSIKKGLTTDPTQGPVLPSVTACVVFRAAEAYLNYMEADCELNSGNLPRSGKSMEYWKSLRQRVGMDPSSVENTLNNTDLSKEIDLARYSGDNLISSDLYNIRRERRVELAAEGYRFRDLIRWRALDKMQNYHVEGFDLWDENYKRYTSPDKELNGKPFDKELTVKNLIEYGSDKSNVSAKSDGVYLRPYRILNTNIAYNGYNWNQNKYLNPISFDSFRLTTAEEGSSDYSTSTIYQNPGWKIEVSSLPEGD